MRHFIFGVWIVAFVGSAMSLSAAEEKKKAPAKDTAEKAVAKPKVQNPKAEKPKSVVIGAQAPQFKIKDVDGKLIDLAKLTAKGPVLVRLTCGCLGCDKELAYFRSIHKSYEKLGLTSVAIFKEPDKKVRKYVKEKKLKMLYAVDTKGDSWKTFETTTMPTNFLIAKGGQIKSIAAGCDPSGLVAKHLSLKVADLLGAKAVDPQKQVATQKESKRAAKPTKDK